MVESTGNLLWRLLSAAGVEAVIGVPLPGVPVTPVADPRIAALLAGAFARTRRAPAARATFGAIEFGDLPLRTHVVVEAGQLPAAVSSAAVDARAGRACRIELALDLERPADPLDRVERLPGATVPDTEQWRERLATAQRPVVLAGPGVVEAGAVAALRAFAAAGDMGVLNTWGAKGLFHWQSPHHWATVGLQRDDFHLGGLARSDLIVAVGLDPDESPAERWQLAANIEVPPEALGALARTWSARGAVADVPPLRTRLAAVTQRGWAVAGSPLTPVQATRNYAAVVAGGGFVAADAGTAGFWVARTLGTTGLDSVVVPARPEQEGFAVACALAVRLQTPARPVLAVVDAPLGPRSRAVLAVGEELGLPVPVEIWDPNGRPVDADTHAVRLTAAVEGADPAVLSLATDPRRLLEMIDVAGPVVAWSGSWRRGAARPGAE